MHQALVSESTDAYDLIIIDGGPTGVVGATTATAAKKKTAVIDCCHELGGAGSRFFPIMNIM
jgi:pyruvate/2-oxoglutarate dehydrogenase complex dihydrolipoamide dehydrogenase (E3) component